MHIKSHTVLACAGFIVFAVIVSLALTRNPVRLASAIEALPPAVPVMQEEEEEDENEERDLERQLGSLERTLDKVEAELEEADEAGDDDLVERLEQAAEEIEQQIERIERQLEGEDEDEDEDWEDEEEEEHDEHEHQKRELELRIMELELENRELELKLRRFETTGRMIDIAENSTTTAAYAILQLHEYLGEEDAVEALSELLDRLESPFLKRLARLRLAALNHDMDRIDATWGHLKALILGVKEGEE